MKIYGAEIIDKNSHKISLKTDNNSYIHITTATGTLQLNEIQLAGKRKMDVVSFLRGNSLDGYTLLP